MALAGSRAGFAGTVLTPLEGRFLTHVSILRVNQLEVTPTRNLGNDEAADNSPANVRLRREAFAKGCPRGRMTWAVSWLALHDTRKEYVEARRLLVEYHDKYGDEITFIPGGYYAPLYDTRRIYFCLLDWRRWAGFIPC